jgi:TolB-like protein
MGMYIVVAWVGVQVASLVFPAVNTPDAALRFVWFGFILAFPIVMVFAWLYDITPEGITRTPPANKADVDLKLRKTDYSILVVLIAVLSAMAFQLSGKIREFGQETPLPSVSMGIDAHTVAVLPLENVSNDESQQFFVDGMQEALMSMLSRVSALKVISRTSVRRFANTEKSLLEIGQELGAANIIEGSVFRQGSSIRITIRLINAATDQLIWANIYDRQMEDVLRLQSELARAIAGEVQVMLTPEESAYLSSASQVEPDAYENYLKGRFHWYRFGENDLELALEYFQSAIDIDPRYALAYVGLADALATPGHIGFLPSADVFPKAEKLVAKALELDPLLAEAHDLSARIQFVWNFDWLSADRGFRESIRLKPSYPDARIVYSQFLGIQQRWEESLDQVRAGQRLDPLNDWFHIEVGARLGWMGRYEEALEEYQKVAEAQPNWFMIYRYLWEAHFYLGEWNRALEAAVKFFKLSGQSRLVAALSGYDGKTDFSTAMLALAEEMISMSKENYVSDFELARVYAFASDGDQTLEWLERAQANKDSSLVYSAAQPVFGFIWDEPRYATLRDKMNLPSRSVNHQ